MNSDKLKTSGETDKTEVCVWCETEFVKDTYYRYAAGRRMNLRCCSDQCADEYAMRQEDYADGDV